MKIKKTTKAEDRILLTESLYEENLKIQNKTWKPFWKSFESFEDLDFWKKRQKDPRLW